MNETQQESKQRDMHVVHVINNLPVGGAERFLLQLASAQQRLGLRVTIVTLVHPNPLFEELTRREIPHTCIGRKRLNDPRLVLDLRRILGRMQPDVVHTHLFYADTFGRIAARTGGIRAVVSTEHSTEAGSISSRRLAGMRWTTGLAHRLVAVSEAVRRSMSQRLKVDESTIRVIPNGIELDGWSEVQPLPRSAIGVEPNALVVGCVGRMIESKGYAELLDAIARLGPVDLQLVMVGDGPALGRLQSRSHELSLADRIQWLGLRSDVPRVLKSLDVFAMPSLWEGHSVALLEAMAAGCACLVSDIPEIVESVGEAAVRVRPGDVDSIAAGLRELLDTPERRRVLAIEAQRAVQRFSIEAAARAYHSLYNEVLAESACARNETHG